MPHARTGDKPKSAIKEWLAYLFHVPLFPLVSLSFFILVILMAAFNFMGKDVPDPAEPEELRLVRVDRVVRGILLLSTLAALTAAIVMGVSFITPIKTIIAFIATGSVATLFLPALIGFALLGAIGYTIGSFIKRNSWDTGLGQRVVGYMREAHDFTDGDTTKSAIAWAAPTIACAVIAISSLVSGAWLAAGFFAVCAAGVAYFAKGQHQSILTTYETIKIKEHEKGLSPKSTEMDRLEMDPRVYTPSPADGPSPVSRASSRSTSPVPDASALALGAGSDDAAAATARI